MSTGEARIDLAAAAYQVAKGDLFLALDIALDIRALATDLMPLLEATAYRGRLEGIERVKVDPARAIPGKAQITLVNIAGEPESIETGWLSPGSAALEVARRAHKGIGRMATFYKTFDPSTNPRHSKGYRHLLWLVVDPPESET